MSGKVPFSPQGGTGQKISATQTHARAAIGHATGQKQIALSNAGANTAFIKFGGDDVTAAVDEDMAILSGEVRIVSITSGATHIGVICDTGETATIFVMPGTGS